MNEVKFIRTQEYGYYTVAPGVVHLVVGGVDIGPIDEVKDPPLWSLQVRNTGDSGKRLACVLEGS